MLNFNGSSNAYRDDVLRFCNYIPAIIHIFKKYLTTSVKYGLVLSKYGLVLSQKGG